MPPKAAPRGRAPRGGARGRGRSVTSTPAAEGPAVTADSTPANFEIIQDSTQPSPNSSPPDAPTEAPAPTPARVPVQRLATISRSNSTSSAATAKPAAGASKFKPKNRRRDQEERAKAEEEERQKQLQRNKDAARAEGRGRGRGRGRGARGRGDAMGRGELTRNAIKASGPFAEAPAAPDRKPGMFAPSSFSRQPSGPGAASGATFGGSTKREGGGGGSGTTFSGSRGGGYDPLTGIRIKEEIPEPIYPDEDETGYSAPRVDIEHINLVSDDDDEPAVSSKGKGRAGTDRIKDKGGLRPVRLAREEHKERVTIVNTEASGGDLDTEKPSAEEVADEADDDGMFVPQDLDAERSEAPGHDEEVRIKPEPGLGDDADISDTPMVEASGIDEPEVSVGKEEPPTPRKAKARRKSSMKEKKPVLQTEEDRAEWERHKEDVQILAEELGGLQTSLAAQADGEGDAAMEDAQVKDKEGRMYLFQFPPILPPLYNAVKKEEDDGDIEMSGASGATENDGSKGTPMDLTNKPDPVVKREHENNEFVVPGELIPEPGFIGKLIVRESGKVELSWGGTSLELSRGADMEFLTTTMIIDGLEGEMSEEMVGKIIGSGSGLGSIKGKFVATPDWGKVL